MERLELILGDLALRCGCPRPICRGPVFANVTFRGSPSEFEIALAHHGYVVRDAKATGFDHDWTPARFTEARCVRCRKVLDITPQ